MCLAHDWNTKSYDRWWQLVFTSVSQVLLVRYPRIILFCQFVISDTPCPYPHYRYHITHICWGVLQRENPIHYPWEWEIVIPTILYTIHCGFFSTSTSPFPNSWEVDSPNTYHTHPECKVRFWCCWEALEEAICLVDAIQLNCVIQKAREDKCWQSLGSRSLEGSSTWGRLGLKGLLLFVYFNLFFSWSIYRVKGGREVFGQVFQFPLQ